MKGCPTDCSSALAGDGRVKSRRSRLHPPGSRRRCSMGKRHRSLDALHPVGPANARDRRRSRPDGFPLLPRNGSQVLRPGRRNNGSPLHLPPRPLDETATSCGRTGGASQSGQSEFTRNAFYPAAVNVVNTRLNLPAPGFFDGPIHGRFNTQQQPGGQDQTVAFRQFQRFGFHIGKANHTLTLASWRQAVKMIGTFNDTDPRSPFSGWAAPRTNPSGGTATSGPVRSCPSPFPAITGGSTTPMPRASSSR